MQSSTAPVLIKGTTHAVSKERFSYQIVLFIVEKVATYDHLAGLYYIYLCNNNKQAQFDQHHVLFVLVDSL